MAIKILCSTRGGKDSYPNQDWAIEMAKERQAELVFLYVSNVQFLSTTARAKLVDIETELDHMGDFLLTMAQERAQAAGVQARTSVQRGVFHEVLKHQIQEIGADVVVMGSSRRSTTPITTEYLEQIGEQISRETGVYFVVLTDGEVLCTFGEEP